MRESKVEAHLKAKVGKYGGTTRKMVWPGRRGAPDRMVMFNECYGPEALAAWMDNLHAGHQHYHPLVELKRPGKDAEAHQAREHERLRAAGFIVLVLDSTEAIDEIWP
jgi:hypothetical protein